jgi:hypothetical protein
MNNPDHISKSLETIFWVKILQFFDADPGWKKFGSGVRDKHPGFATLLGFTKEIITQTLYENSVKEIHMIISIIVLLSVADPDPGSGAFLTPGSGIRDRFFPDPGSRIPNPYF